VRTTEFLDRTNRRWRIFRSHFGFHFFLGWTVFAVLYLGATKLAPQEWVIEHKVALALVLALTSTLALFFLAWALCEAISKQP
jgi:hypothetical protein